MVGLTRFLATAGLSDAAFAARHRVLSVILWVHLPLIAGVALLGKYAEGSGAALWSVIAAVAVCSVLAGVLASRRGRALAVAVGLLLAADALVHAGGGLTDLHFHFFVVLALISLYQDWVTFAVAIGGVAIHHLGAGMLSPHTVFSDPRAHAAPLGWALLHAAFVLAMCAAQMVYWKFAADAQADAERLRGEAAEETERARQAAAEGALARVAATEAEAEATALAAQRERAAARLQQVLISVARSGERLGDETDEALRGLQEALDQAHHTSATGSDHAEQVRAAAEGAHSKIGSLRSAVTEIATIATVINQVARQTNLLALNATIEAARAGDAGRGFGVVAGEVKELAGQTAGATARIETTLEQITSGADAVAEMVDSVTRQLAQFAETQRETADALAGQRIVAARTREFVASVATDVAGSAAHVDLEQYTGR